MKIVRGKDGRYCAYGTMKGRPIAADGATFAEAMTEFHTLAVQSKENQTKRDNENETRKKEIHL